MHPVPCSSRDARGGLPQLRARGPTCPLQATATAGAGPTPAPTVRLFVARNASRTGLTSRPPCLPRQDTFLTSGPGPLGRRDDSGSASTTLSIAMSPSFDNLAAAHCTATPLGPSAPVTLWQISGFRARTKSRRRNRGLAPSTPLLLELQYRYSKRPEGYSAIMCLLYPRFLSGATGVHNIHFRHPDSRLDREINRPVPGIVGGSDLVRSSTACSS